MHRYMLKLSTISSSWYIDGWMNDLDFYIIPMLYHRDSNYFLSSLKKKHFFQNCIKLIQNYFLTDFNDFEKIKYWFLRWSWFESWLVKLFNLSYSTFVSFDITTNLHGYYFTNHLNSSSQKIFFFIFFFLKIAKLLFWLSNKKHWKIKILKNKIK